MVLGGEGADPLAVLPFQFPAEGFAAFEGEEAVEIDFGAILLDLDGGAASAGFADANAGEFAVFGCPGKAGANCGSKQPALEMS